MKLGIKQFLAATLACLAAAAACAQAAPPAEASDVVLRRFVERVAAGQPGRIEVKLGQIDSRLQLAPCARIEPFLPAGTRLWGRTSIGVRCVEGANWSVALPVTVSVFGKALVSTGPLAAGSAPTAQDFRIDEVDLTRDNVALVSDPNQLAGRVLARPLAAGLPLRADHLRVPATIAAGDPVKIRVMGEGFSITADGIALAQAGDGQMLRVRTDNGKVVAGIVHDRTVEVK